MISARREYLTRKPVWIASAIIGVSTLAFLALMRLVSGNEGGQSYAVVPETQAQLVKYVSHHSLFYPSTLWKQLGPILASWLLLSGGVLIWKRALLHNLRLALPVAWAISSLLPILVVWAYDERYLSFTYPPLITIAFVTIDAAFRHRLGNNAARCVVTAVPRCR